MKKRVLSLLLTGMMIFSSIPVYAESDQATEETAYEEAADDSGEELSFSDGFGDEENLGENDAAGETDEKAFTEEAEAAGGTDMLFFGDAQALEEENASLEKTADSEEEKKILSSGTLNSGVNWKFYEDGTLYLSGSGIIKKNEEGDYPWEKERVLFLEIEEGITAIESGAFSDCTNLTSVLIDADTLSTVSEDAFLNCSKAKAELYYSKDAPTAIPIFGNAAVTVYYQEANSTWTDSFRVDYANVSWIPCCQVTGRQVTVDHTYVRDNNELQIQTDGNPYPTQENAGYYDLTCSVCGNKDKEYNDCVHCIDTADLQSDHPYNTETTTEWTVSMEGAEEIILTFDKYTMFETNYDDFFYIYDENGKEYQKYINDQLAGKTVVVPGSSVTLKLTTDYSTDEWGFAVTRALGTTHQWESTVTKPAQGDQTGTLTKTCKKCGETVEEVIPAPYIICGVDQGISWGITADHVLEVSPSAAQKAEVPSYRTQQVNGHSVTSAPWGEYETAIEGLRVKKGVTGIGSCAFYGLLKLKWAELDDNIVSIGWEAFHDCSALEKVDLPDYLESIESYAFFGTALKRVRIPRSLRFCAWIAFGESVSEVDIEDLKQWMELQNAPQFTAANGVDYYVNGVALEELVIPEEITKIRDYAFYKGRNIKNVTFHKEVQAIGAYAFGECKNLDLKVDKLPNYLKSIGDAAFMNCEMLSKVAIPASVINIGSSAFSGCSSLTQVVFAQDIQLEKIPSEVFSRCGNLKKICIPSSVTAIGNYVFLNCYNLKVVEFAPESKLNDIGGGVFSECSLESIIIPKGVTQMGNYAFSGNDYTLKNITFLGDYANFKLEMIGEYNSSTQITYYACNDTWSSEAAKSLLSNYTANPVHMSEQETTVTPATCTTDGEKTFVCDNCNQTFTEVIPSSGHTWEVKEHKAATCVEKGYDIQVCSACQEEKRTELEIDPTAHQYDEGKVVEATCSRGGYTVYTCTLCGNEKHEDYTPSTDHAYEEIVVKATCQTSGYIRHQCKNCGYYYDDNWTDPLEHDYEAKVTFPTCTERGYTYYSCKNCSYSYTDHYVGAAGHHYEKKVIPPTCTEKGYTKNTCSNCGLSYVSEYKKAAGHDLETVVTAPTCTTEGYTTSTCRNCDYSTTYDYRSAMGHSYQAERTESTCTTEGFTTYTCVTCHNSYIGEKTDKAPHSWDAGTVTKEATYLEKGTKEYRCLDCGVTYTEDIPVLDQISLKDCTVTLAYQRTTYNGNDQTPKVTVKTKNQVVREEDYTVIYEDNQNAGEARVTVTAKGGDVCITGSQELTFVIEKAKQNATAKVNGESIHVGTTEPIAVNGLGKTTILSENEDIAQITDENMILGKKAGTTYLRISFAGDKNHAQAEIRLLLLVDEDHTFKVTGTTAATCTVPGTITSVCERCGKEITQETQLDLVNGHDYEMEETAPTCVEKGYKTYTCRNCGKVKVTDYQAAKGHTYEKETVAPTCTQRGYIIYTCTVCGDKVTDDYREPLDHVYEKTVIPSSCTKKGYTIYKCTRCEESYEGNETDVTSHSWNNGTITKKANYIENGTREYKCENCDATCTEDIPALEQTSLAECDVTLSYYKTAYNGKEKKPEITVKVNNRVVEEADYTVTYADNKNAGTARVIITAKPGNVCITGKVEKTFVIGKAKQSLIAATAEERIHVNVETPIQINGGVGNISLTTSDTDLVEIRGTKIVGKKAGLALIRVTASGDANREAATSTAAVWIDGNHVIQKSVENKNTLANGDIEFDDVEKCTICGTVSKRIHKSLQNLNTESCVISLPASTYIFDGGEVKPQVSVTLSGKTLTEGEDYRLEYKNNDRAGEASVSVVGIGSYTNAKEKSFRILAALETPQITSLANASKGMKLTWTKTDGAQGYIIYRATGNGAYKELKNITSPSTTSYVDTTATANGERYTYAVSGYNGNIKSKYAPKSYYCLTRNRISSAKNSASKKMTVKWKKNTKATGYQVYYVTGTKQKTAVVKSNKKVSILLKSLKKGATYSVKIRAYKTVSGTTYYSEWSSVKKVKIQK